MVKNKLPVIATIDIESHPAKVLMYGNTWEPVIVKIIEFETILSASIKIGDKKTIYIGLNTIKGYKKGDRDDKKLLIEISKILSDPSIDFFCGQNFDDFDIKKINERIMFHKLPPLPDVPTLDTKKLHSRVSKLPNNKLNTQSQFHGNGKKTAGAGPELFIACGEGDPKAWKLNEIYNKNDVEMTYKNLLDVLPYAKLPNTYSRINADINCSNVLCLSTHLTKSKRRRVTNGWKQQWQCGDCGKYTTDSKIIKE